MAVRLFVLGCLVSAMVAAASSAQATQNGWRINADNEVEACDISLPEGRYNSGISQADCCTIVLGEVPETEACEPVARALHNKRMRALNRAIAATTRNTIARFLRANPDTSISSFTVELPPLTSVAFCCDCNPSDIFCGDSPNECDSPTEGVCPSDKERWLCTDAGGQDCLPLD